MAASRSQAGSDYVAAVEMLHQAYVELSAWDMASGTGTRGFGSDFPDPVDLRHGEFLPDLKGDWKYEARTRRAALG